MSELRADTITASDGTSPVTLTKQSAAKAFVEGSNAAALSKSFNISTGTDNGTGDYSYALINSMDSATYAISVCCHSGGLGATNNDSQTASVYKAQIFSRTSTGSASDQVNYSAIHGDLA